MKKPISAISMTRVLILVLTLALLLPASFAADNCRIVPNPTQHDLDKDGIGDFCDECTDTDKDGFGNPGYKNFCENDNCPEKPNSDQKDKDNDGDGDACDVDLDNDGIPDNKDNCKLAANDGQQDTDNDHEGDECDADDDNDGIHDLSDNCPLVENNKQEDLDKDSNGDACDKDIDGDTFPDSEDNCPTLNQPDQKDNDNDGKGDLCDDDDDNDGVSDEKDNCPTTRNKNQKDEDSDGIGDVCDPEASAPKIETVLVSPSRSTTGTKFTILATITDPAGISMVNPPAVVISREDTTLVTVLLFDDGEHGDKGREDNIFAGTWDSVGQPEGEYIISIIAEDRFGNPTAIEKAAVITITSNKCIEVLNNGDPEDKINIIFIGDGFASSEDFREQVKLHAGIRAFNGENLGILSREPFSSNKNRFNIYLVDTISNDICKDSFDNTLGSCDTAKATDLALQCPTGVVSVLSTRSFRPYAYFGAISFVPVSAGSSQETALRASAHEFGHSFGSLLDEYVEPGSELLSPAAGVDYSPNCYYDSSAKDSDCAPSTCASGDGCLSSCMPVDPDCARGCLPDKICNLDCASRGMPDADCTPDVFCNKDSMCTSAACTPPDPDCALVTGDSDGICDSRSLGRTELDKDCQNFDQTIFCKQDGICKDTGCQQPDQDCGFATCSAGDRCVIGCTPVDPDCGDGKSCAAGDGCFGGSCTPPDPDCMPATCADSDACLAGCSQPLETQPSGSSNDPDCAIRKTDDGMVPDVCTAGNICAVGCTPTDPDCGGGKSCAAGDGCAGGSCFTPLTKEACAKAAPWKDLNGAGCGKPNEFDCPPKDVNAYLEVNCFEGCGTLGKEIFRPSLNTLMRNHFIDPYSYGPVNERHLCKQIKALTKGADGTCTQYGIT